MTLQPNYGQWYKHSTVVIYNSRVAQEICRENHYRLVNYDRTAFIREATDCKYLVITTLEF